MARGVTNLIWHCSRNTSCSACNINVLHWTHTGLLSANSVKSFLVLFPIILSGFHMHVFRRSPSEFIIIYNWLHLLLLLHLLLAKQQSHYGVPTPSPTVFTSPFCCGPARWYRDADKSLARPGRIQAKVSVRMAWISFGALLFGEKNLMTTRVSMLLKSRASLTCFRACFLPGRAKDLSASRCSSLP